MIASGNRLGVLAVAGATGFLGSHVARAARLRNIEVTTLTRTDFESKGLVRRIQEADCVVGSHGVVGRRSPTEFEESNVRATALLASACRQAQTNYLHISSGAVLGARIIDDSLQLAPRTPYASSKARAEQLVTLEVSRGLSAMIARPTSVHGPGRPTTMQLIRCLERYPFPVVAHGESPFPFSWVGYVAAALVDLAIHPFRPSEPVVVVAERRAPTANEFLAAWHEITGKPVRSVNLHPRIGKSIVSLAASLSRLPPVNRFPVGAFEMLDYKGWKSCLTDRVKVREVPLVEAVGMCTGGVLA